MPHSLKSIITAAALCVCAVAHARDLSPAAAVTEARRDIESGHIKIYIAGGRAANEAGVARSDLDLIRGVPRDQRLSQGCVDSDLPQHLAYAEAYNRIIVQYLRSHHPHT
jgi:hypothetical protein